MQTSAHEERNREADRIRSDSHKEIARIQLQLEQETLSAAKMARLEVQRYAAKLAIDLAEQKVRARMTPDVQSALLESFLKDFPARAPSGTPWKSAAARKIREINRQ